MASNFVVEDDIVVTTKQDDDEYYHNVDDELSLHSALQPMNDERAAVAAVGAIPAASEHSIHYAYSLERDSKSTREEGKNCSCTLCSG